MALVKSIGADKQDGLFVEPSYRFTDKIGVFARYSIWDTLAGSDVDTEATQINVGINYWPHDSVVVKLDVEKYEKNNDEWDGLNLGIGYQF